MRCPVCGAPNGACTGHAPFDPSKVFDLGPTRGSTGGPITMATTGVEGKGRDRYPQQHVRAGRGTPGYTGNVEVYATAIPKSFEGDAGIHTLVTNEDADKKFTDMKVDELRAALEAKGLPTDGNKGDLIARLEDAG